MLNFLLLAAFGIFVFGVPFTGSFLTLSAAALLYVIFATGTGLVISAFMRSQIAAIFGTAVLTMLPTFQFSGLMEPVTSLQGFGAAIGHIYPATYFVTIARGTFSKALGFGDLAGAFVPLIIAVPVIIGLGAVLVRKQAR